MLLKSYYIDNYWKYSKIYLLHIEMGNKQMEFGKKVLTLTLVTSLFTGIVGVYAGTVLDRYKTPRGNIVTVEPVNIHKNRIGITVNGEKTTKDSWYADSVTYVPLREIAELLGASVNYNSETMSADIVTESDLLELLGLQMQREYIGSFVSSDNYPYSFKITSFNPSTNEFKGNATGYLGLTMGIGIVDIQGNISETKITYKDPRNEVYEFTYDGATKKYNGSLRGSSSKITFSLE
jgi:hypothetical protein